MLGLTAIPGGSAIAERAQANDPLSAVIDSVSINIHRYRPARCEPRGLLLIFHGYERNAASYLRRARRIARRQCLALYAPELDRERFPRAVYQRADSTQRESTGHSSRMGKLLGGLVAWARKDTGNPTMPYYLFGHSAGAQMLSRVTAYNPMPDPHRIVIANPSAYVSPDLVELAPYGFGSIRDLAERELRLRAYLAQPITIYVGSADRGEKLLDRRPAAERQGSNRFQRGVSIFHAASELAAKRNWPFRWRLVIAPNIGHSSSAMLRAAALEEALEDEPSDLASP